jgi:hypothetical protein
VPPRLFFSFFHKGDEVTENKMDRVCSGQDSSVGTVTRYGLEGPGIETRWGGGARFSAPVQTGRGAHPASYTMDTVSLIPGVKRPGRGVDHPPHPAPRLKKEKSYTSTPPLGLRGLF